MRRLIWALIELFYKLSKRDKKLITILFRGYSGSNISPILERINGGELNEYKIKVFHVEKLNARHENESFIKSISSRMEYLKYLYKSEMVISTHGVPRVRKTTKLFNFWHGIPLKGMSLMNNSETDQVGHINDDYFLSTSEFYNTLMNACIGIKSKNYKVLGYPRNDYLLNENGRENLEKIIGRKTEQKVILYMPTFQDQRRDSDGFLNNKKANFFGFENFNLSEFQTFLKANNILFLLKLHPNEESYFKNIYKQYIDDNIMLLEGNHLEHNQMDLYKIINGVDLLITDFSSIYFDYLLLDKPIIFTPVNLQEYRRTRGILLEPYDFWTPGPKCIEQQELQSELTKSLEDTNYYSEERKNIRNIMHKYQDGNSTDRVIGFIKEIMES